IAGAERAAAEAEQLRANQAEALRALVAGTATAYPDGQELVVDRSPEGKSPIIFDRQSMPEWFAKGVKQAMRLHQVKAAVQIREQATERLASELQVAAEEVERRRPELAPEMQKARNAAYNIQAALQAQQRGGG